MVLVWNHTLTPERPIQLKYSKSDVVCKTHKLPNLEFEQQTLTSFAGLLLVQAFMAATGFKDGIVGCFRHLGGSKIYSFANVFLMLVVHVLLGFSRLREIEYYRDDPMVKRLLGLKQLPDVSTISRRLKEADPRSVEKLRANLRDGATSALVKLALRRVTLDFDGSIQSTKGHAEGTAVGFNKRKKGDRSYYPLFATIAEIGQVLDVLHRPGNVHDSRGARAFMLECIAAIRRALPGITIEIRADSAFFSDEIVSALDGLENVEFTLSVPFQRFAKLKGFVEQRRRWHRLNGEVSYFEKAWKPKCWNRRFRFLFVRTRVKVQQKGPVQLDLFVPYEHDHQFKVVVTNKRVHAGHVLRFHEGRGGQENLFSELKSDLPMGNVPVRTLVGNQVYLLAVLHAHNLTRSIQMAWRDRDRRTTPKRAAMWIFDRAASFRAKYLCRAGRFTRPQNELTLTISGNRSVEREIRDCLDAMGRIETEERRRAA